MRLSGADEESGYLTLGWRLAAPWYAQGGKWVCRASLALRQDLGGDRLASLRLDLSLDRELGDNGYLGLTYAGHYAEDARDNALAARLSLKF